MSGILVPKPMLGRQLPAGRRLSRGLVGAWLMNEAGGGIISDLSGNNLNGTLADGAAWTSGKYGNALCFEGTDDNVRISRSTVLEPSQLTIIASIKPTGFVSGENEIVLSKTYNNDTDAPYSSYNLQFGRTTTTFALFMGFTDNSFNWHESNVGAISNNEQMTLAVSYDGENVRLYKNGVLDNTVAQTKTIKYDTTSNGDLWFGVTGGNKTIDYTGNQDWVLIYNRALTAREIAERSLRPFADFEREPLPLWTAATQGVEVTVGMAGAMTTNTGYWGY